MLRYRNLVCGCVPHAWGAFAPAKGSLNNMKAIIPAAGLGTRFLPGTKCTPKEMLPVLDKPVIQYVVEEALDPEEVDDAIIVTSPGKPELLNYFQPDRSLENLLRERGKNAYADAVAHAGGMPVDFRYQYEPKGLGHAIRSAADAVAGENFLVLLGDYVVPNRDICDKMLAVSRSTVALRLSPSLLARPRKSAATALSPVSASVRSRVPRTLPMQSRALSGVSAVWSRSPLPRRLRPTCTLSAVIC